MKPIQISYSESKESVDAIGLKSWRKAGVEIELEDAESPEKGFDKARMIVYEALNPYPITVNPDYAHLLQVLPIGTPNPYPPNVFYQTSQLPVIDSAKEKIEIAIDNCESLYELDLLMGDVAKHGLVAQWLEKKKHLK